MPVFYIKQGHRSLIHDYCKIVTFPLKITTCTRFPPNIKLHEGLSALTCAPFLLRWWLLRCTSDAGLDFTEQRATKAKYLKIPVWLIRFLGLDFSERTSCCCQGVSRVCCRALLLLFCGFLRPSDRCCITAIWRAHMEVAHVIDNNLGQLTLRPVWCICLFINEFPGFAHTSPEMCLHVFSVCFL